MEIVSITSGALTDIAIQSFVAATKNRICTEWRQCLMILAMILKKGVKMAFDNYVCEGQMNLFDYINDSKPLQITKPIRLIELFAGIGSQYSALKRIGANVIHHKAIEFDKYACMSYNAIHGTNIEPTDICTVKGGDLQITETESFTYLLTHFRVSNQDLSVAGKGRGMTKDSGTRSGLLWEVERLLKECKEYNGNLPQVLLMENVTQVHGKKNIADFKQWIDF